MRKLDAGLLVVYRILSIFLYFINIVFVLFIFKKREYLIVLNMDFDYTHMREKGSIPIKENLHILIFISVLFMLLCFLSVPNRGQKTIKH